ncbi:ABC transporter substrate-binding protein [Rhodoplanes sp. TEM]|uniref:ABC transporter substrate-binding protein n=1 Tax=Rhodoplanes tepidamans TaxID=200616 RepID=A0ABT5J809_RHOTP|nr:MULTISPECIES: ABC transporter substrate-binding protein [Rhodoplanes]MDC7785526.1 ABC transporter substrate-binding protein [Rhodoplanes tepidamans]MDC7986192.1 ABC transporter substrate-binding protein [Rhodoplanes sp. TEM]MDQ0353304.1 NitT/TauT family transport system substrate-binding protein [Rhodoplanes tepidamans]
MSVRKLAALLAAAAVTLTPVSASAQEKIKIGYWSSGFSVGFGAVLEVGKFLEAQGLAPEYIKFSDVNGPTKALLTHSIDAAFGAPATGAFTLGGEGAPIELVLVNQIAEATFVTKDGSPIKSLEELKGKKVGMSPAGSAMYAISTSVLEKNHGLKRSDYTAVAGNEGRLLQFLSQGDIDAAALRAVTIASVPDMKLKRLGSVVEEWKTMTKGSAPPILGVALVHKDFARQSPQAVTKFVTALIAATRFGSAETAKASEILSKSANLDARDATSYARLWDQFYVASLGPDDIANLKAEAEVFRASGTLEKPVPDSLFVPTYYEQAKK